MAEYINKEHLDRKFIVKMLSPTTTTIFDAKDIIDELQPADVIERYKIDKAIDRISNIEQLVEYTCEDIKRMCIDILRECVK